MVELERPGMVRSEREAARADAGASGESNPLRAAADSGGELRAEHGAGAGDAPEDVGTFLLAKPCSRNRPSMSPPAPEAC
ncbi:hypothetical protein AB0467_12270 [Streptomyces sp. NPDC052095]|uniref:hypothetical protein n=1 Tax=unclassified Streptomyces TaxID=2593676 RepID=UPI00344C9AF5